jgi:hypothetical protein
MFFLSPGFWLTAFIALTGPYCGLTGFLKNCSHTTLIDDGVNFTAFHAIVKFLNENLMCLW